MTAAKCCKVLQSAISGRCRPAAKLLQTCCKGAANPLQSTVFRRLQQNVLQSAAIPLQTCCKPAAECAANYPLPTGGMGLGPPHPVLFGRAGRSDFGRSAGQ